jgi:cytochrome c556
MIQKYRLHAVLAGALVLAGCAEPQDTRPGQPVAHRKQIFKQMLKKDFEPMGLAVRGQNNFDAPAFKAMADDLAALAKQPWPYFTPDSNYPPTKAKPGVWEKPQQFKEEQERFVKATEALARASASGSLDAIRPAFEDVHKSCESCHKAFRRS